MQKWEYGRLWTKEVTVKSGLKRNSGYLECLFNGKVICKSNWEYEINNISQQRWNNDAANLIDALNILGKEGWELVSRLFYNDNTLCLKRPIE